MRIDLRRGRFLRVTDGAGSTVTAHAIVASLKASTRASPGRPSLTLWPGR